MWRVLSWVLIAAAGLIIVGVLVLDSPGNNAMWWGLSAALLAFAGIAAANRGRQRTTGK